MSWLNTDGLYIKAGKEEGAVTVGGLVQSFGNKHVITVDIDYTEALSATAAIVDGGTAPGPFGVIIPKGLRVEEVEISTTTAFTSSGTIAAATFVLGSVSKTDRSTAISLTAFTTAAFVGSAFAALGTKNVLRVGSTGAGALIGTTLAADNVLVIANTLHGTNPFTAGKAQVRIIGYFP